jgi:hypothetical protein
MGTALDLAFLSGHGDEGMTVSDELIFISIRTLLKQTLQGMQMADCLSGNVNSHTKEPQSSFIADLKLLSLDKFFNCANQWTESFKGYSKSAKCHGGECVQDAESVFSLTFMKRQERNSKK